HVAGRFGQRRILERAAQSLPERLLDAGNSLADTLHRAARRALADAVEIVRRDAAAEGTQQQEPEGGQTTDRTVIGGGEGVHARSPGTDVGRSVAHSSSTLIEGPARALSHLTGAEIRLDC